LSVRANARQRGVSHVVVLRAAKAGHIPLESDGTIDAAKADAAWAQSSDRGRKPRAWKRTFASLRSQERRAALVERASAAARVFPLAPRAGLGRPIPL
jgi:hypothetical protein